MSLENNIVALAEAMGSDVKDLREGKVDKVAGKGLSDTNFTQAEKTKLAGVAAAATKNRADTLNADKTHTHTTAQVTGLDTALAAKASKAELTDGLALKIDVVSGKGLSDTNFTQAEKTKLTGITAGATKNRADSLNADSVHTHSIAQVTGLDTALGTKVDKVAGKGLSDTNFTQVEKTKLSGIATGGNNTALGAGALSRNDSGGNNTALGAGALSRNDSGEYNTALGVYALSRNTTGDYNTALGVYALRYSERGSNNTALGRNALGFDGYYNNCSGFGYAAQVTASNQVQLGNANTTVYAYGAVQNRSDARDKAEVRDTVLGLDFINAIRPVDYKLDMREDYRVELGEEPTKEQLEANKLGNIQADGTHIRKRYHHGVIAQEVADVIDTLGVDFGGFQDHSKNGGDDVLSIGYEEFIAPLIKAVQELSARVEELEGKVEYE